MIWQLVDDEIIYSSQTYIVYCCNEIKRRFHFGSTARYRCRSFCEQFVSLCRNFPSLGFVDKLLLSCGACWMNFEIVSWARLSIFRVEISARARSEKNASIHKIMILISNLIWFVEQFNRFNSFWFFLFDLYWVFKF